MRSLSIVWDNRLDYKRGCEINSCHHGRFSEESVGWKHKGLALKLRLIDNHLL